MKKINSIHPSGDIKIGDVLAENISDGADLVAADNSEYL
jgi:CxxC motif-containing protein